MKFRRGTGGVSRPRLRLERAQRKAPDRWVLDKDQAHHLVHVRRCVEGDRVEGLLNGRLFLLKLAAEEGYLCGILEKELPAGPGKNLWLLLALLKMDAFERSLRIATESGAGNIVPLFCERSVVRLDEKRWSSKQKRWTKIIEESTRQACVPQRPVLYEPLSVGSAMSLPLPENRYAAMLSKDAKLLVDCKPSGGAVFAVGPEGDWTRSECETLSGKGFTAVSLGRGIMRSPTAVAVGLGFLSMRLEQCYEN
ncbi:MAG: RsmE family RNA methyltransferase [Thermovirgaceae bacterium]